MTFSRSRLALLAAALIAALVIVGFLYTNAQKHQSAAPGTTASSAPAAQGDDEDSTEGQDTADGTAPTIAAIPAGPAAGTATDVKTVHSPNKVAIDLNLAPGQCKARTIDAAAGLYLPDPACTPGAVDPAVTQDNLASTICKSGYTTTVRAPASDTDKTKVLSLTQYGQTKASTTEYDHLISLQLGGTNAVSNLWPEPNRAGAPGTTNPKDAIETRLNKAVCAHRVTLAAAQKAVATNWVTAEKDLGL
ncbi:hypothetical protein PUN71_022795 [Arthrobacter sp. NQ7]|uniref:hypothetical protein n=1 Tax=Arthrobacter sp. NQ7 TaxID=3032303 RepID=UPI00240EAC36|nr:hypothetical protein [Arthrobacter sp. NQ7]MDJ0460042.1 hypothetical protein [Arthrobacter sp. NQ7]